MRYFFLCVLVILLSCSSSEKGQQQYQDILDHGQDGVVTDAKDGLSEDGGAVTEHIGDELVPQDDGSEVAEDKGAGADEGVSKLDKGGEDKGTLPAEDIKGDLPPEVAPSAHYKGVVRAISSGDQKEVVAGAMVRALSPSTGLPLPGYEAVSDSEGNVEFYFDWVGAVGFKMSKENFVDSYQFDQRTDSVNGDLDMLPVDFANMVLSALGAQKIQGKGIVTGNVEWRSSTGSGQVGCATVTALPSCQIFYFGADGMPKKSEAQNMTSAKNGGFLALNCEPEKTHFQAKINGTVVGEGDAFIYADGITLRFTITITSESDPTPANCAY